MPLQILIDSRERHTALCAALTALPEVVPSYARLPVADYVVSDAVGVERKSIGDLVSSIADRRLFEQAARLRLSFARPVLLIEGSPAEVADRMAPGAIQGALAALVVRLGITVITVATAEEGASQIRFLARHAEPCGEPELDLRTRKAGTDRLAAEYLVQGLPGVGPRRARLLLEHFGSAGAVFAAPRDALLEVRGIGKVLADRLRHVLTAAYA